MIFYVVEFINNFFEDSGVVCACALFCFPGKYIWKGFPDSRIIKFFPVAYYFYLLIFLYYSCLFIFPR